MFTITDEKLSRLVCCHPLQENCHAVINHQNHMAYQLRYRAEIETWIGFGVLEHVSC